MKYKKYIVFAWWSYEARGGLRDIQESFDTLDEGKEFIDNNCECDCSFPHDNRVIVDRDTWETVYNGNE